MGKGELFPFFCAETFKIKLRPYTLNHSIAAVSANLNRF